MAMNAARSGCHKWTGLISIDSIVMSLSHLRGLLGTVDVYPRGQQGISTVGGWCDLLERKPLCSFLSSMFQSCKELLSKNTVLYTVFDVGLE